MAWEHPRTWLPEKITVDKLNTEIRDKFDALKSPPTGIFTSIYANDASPTPYENPGTSFVNVHSDFNLSLTTGGGDVLLAFRGMIQALGSGPDVYFDVAWDSSRLGGVDGIAGSTIALFGNRLGCFYWLLQDVEAGLHTARLQWKASNGVALQRDYRPQFWAREIS